MNESRVSANHLEIDTRAGEAYRALRLRIFNLGLQPGDSFNLEDISLELGITRAPVREALARLAREGFVELVSQTRYQVTPITVAEARDLFALRALIEGEAALLAAREGGDFGFLAEFDALWDSGYDAQDPATIGHFLEADREFHLTMAELSGNVWLCAALRQVIDNLERYMYLALLFMTRGDELVREHRELLSAFVQGDPGRAWDVARSHVHSSRRLVLEALLAYDAARD